MNNSNKLKDDIRKHNGTAWAKAWLEESENELKSHAADAIRYLMVNLDNSHHDIYLGRKLDKKDECPHTSKRKEGIRTLFWVCNKCGKDLGDV